MIHRCSSKKMPTFSVIFNGKSSSWFDSSSGIRSGDPLSPFFFLFGRTLLDLELKRKIAEGKLNYLGTCVSNNISLLAYADDVMIITKASPNNVHALLEVLSNFKR